MIFAYYFFLFFLVVLIKKIRILNPLIFFVLLTTITTTLYVFDDFIFDIYHYEITNYSHSLRLASVLFFIIGAFLSSFFFIKKINNKIYKNNFHEKILKSSKFLISVMTILIVLKTLYIGNAYGFDPYSILEVRFDILNGNFDIPFYFKIITIFSTILSLILGFIYFKLNNKIDKFWIIIFFVASFLNDLIIADKGGLRNIVFFTFSYITTSRFVYNIPFKINFKIILVPILIIFVYSFINIFRYDDSDSINYFIYGFEHFYGNIIGNIGSSSYFVENNFPKNFFGAYSFSGYYSLFGIDINSQSGLSALDVNSSYNAFIGEGLIYNTTDYIGWLYQDFGFIGIIIFSFIVGFLSYYSYNLVFLKPDFKSISIFSLFMGSIFLNIRGFYFGAPGFLFTLILIYLINYFFKIKINSK